MPLLAPDCEKLGASSGEAVQRGSITLTSKNLRCYLATKLEVRNNERHDGQPKCWPELRNLVANAHVRYDRKQEVKEQAHSGQNAQPRKPDTKEQTSSPEYLQPSQNRQLTFLDANAVKALGNFRILTKVTCC